MKLVLFDIDGTLVMTGGAGMRAMNRAFAHLHGVDGALDGIALAGRTDRGIVRDACARIGPAASLDEQGLETFRAVYCSYLEEEMANGAAAGKRVLPGVRAVLDALAARRDVVLALLTGNFPQSARIKLAHFGLWDYFAWGAFGDAHVDRNELMENALGLAREHLGSEIPPRQVFVVGDTPHDVACARFGGAHAVAVATGFNSVDDLRQAGADVVFEDLSETAEVLRALGC